MRRAAMASVVEELKKLFDHQNLLLQQMVDQNRQFFTRLAQLPTIEKQSIKVLARSSNQQQSEGESRASNMENQLRSCLLKDTSPEVNNEVPRLEFPSFDGVNPRNWVRKCSRYFALYNIPESQRVDVASIHLTGQAATWFANYIAVRKYVDWTDFILDICNRFKDELGSQVIGDFHKLHQSGSASLMLHKTPELSDDSFVASFGGGLKTHLKPFVKALSPLALDDATPFARPREEAAEALQMHQKSSTPKSPLLAAPHVGSEEVQASRRTMHFQPTVEVPTFDGSQVDLTSMYVQEKPGTWFRRYSLGRPHTDLDGVIANLCAGSRDEVDTPIEVAVRSDALQVLDESPKRGPKWVFSEAGGGFLFIAFDPGGLFLLPAMSSRCISRCSSERGMRIVALVTAIVVFDPGGTVHHTTDKLRMRAVVKLQKRLPDAEKPVTFIEDLCWMIGELEIKSHWESKGEVEFCICALEKISGMVNYIKHFNASGLPRSQKHGGLPAVAYGVIKKTSVIAEVTFKQIDEAYNARNEAREIVGKAAKLAEMVSGLSESLSLVENERSELKKLVDKSREVKSLNEPVGFVACCTGPGEEVLSSAHGLHKVRTPLFCMGSCSTLSVKHPAERGVFFMGGGNLIQEKASCHVQGMC